ncbi:MAG: flagellar biosynthesis anti-sigma factor FlgM [Candidatus Hydrogenedentota bacterium]|nr:MAG: flagellar biosynthesis anti-sigma factor FlgM [Candidatus Hydrogenedentota bacterium]
MQKNACFVDVLSDNKNGRKERYNMGIERIGNIGKIFQTNKAKPVKQAKSAPTLGQDTVSISQEAIKAQEVAAAQKTVKSSPDVRAEKVKAAKEKLARGDYDKIDTEVLERVAEKIAEALVRG